MNRPPGHPVYDHAPIQKQGEMSEEVGGEDQTIGLGSTHFGYGPPHPDYADRSAQHVDAVSNQQTTKLWYPPCPDQTHK